MRYYLVAFAFCLTAFAALAEDRGRGREMDAISEDVDHSLSVTLPAEVKFRPERGAKNFIITLPAGRYTAFGKDARGAFFVFDSQGLSVPGNFGIPKKGGVYFPTDEKKPVGVWLFPTRYSPKTGVIYLSDLPADAADIVKKVFGRDRL
jgi:hypothetical protein